MNWEPWTGCTPYSEGCKYCYYYGPYAKRYGQNEVTKTDKFDWPVRRNAKGELGIKGGKTVATCFATDFFLPEADEWRKEAWAMIKERQDLDFLILTKRIDRFMTSLPANRTLYGVYPGGLGRWLRQRESGVYCGNTGNCRLQTSTVFILSNKASVYCMWTNA